MTVIRQASHAGSWYEKRSTMLDGQLKNWLSKVFKSTPDHNVNIPIINSRAFIVPHAGYSYSGPAAAFSYQSIDIEPIKRVFILGPSHHFYLPGCALTNCDEYETPLGNLVIDKDIINELKETGEFDNLALDADEDEHSIEMQLPYVYKVFESKIDEIKIVPILVGGLDTDGERAYGKLLSKYLKDPSNLFLISSDFCHWGSRFRYTFYSDKTPPSRSPSNVRNIDKFTIPIHQSIENLDREGMEKIETLSLDQFSTYLSKTKNTICGRHPIGVLLGMVEHLYPSFERQSEEQPEVQDGSLKENNPFLKFIHYSQSSQVTDPSDSSVSYAAAYLYLPPN